MQSPLVSSSAQHSFDKGDRALLALSTSGQINEYQVVDVDENRKVTYKHKLPYVERTEMLKSENRSLLKRVEDLEKGIDDRKRDEENNKAKLLRWQLVAKAIEAFAILLWQEESAVPESTKARLEQLQIWDVIELRFQSRLNLDPKQRRNKTQVASNAYDAIPVQYRHVLDELTQIKARISADRTEIAHPSIRKSQIEAFLVPHLTEQNEATDLLGRTPSLKVWNRDGIYVSMFEEG